MPSTPVISAIGHIALQVCDLDAAVDNATEILGLRLVERDAHEAFLTSGRPHHDLHYIAGDVDCVHHFGLEAADRGALEEVRRRVAQRGYEVVSSEGLGGSPSAAFAFVGPEEFVYEIYVGMPLAPAGPPPSSFAPNRFGHVNLHSKDLAGTRSFLEEVLDFRLSDSIEGDLGDFLRCNVDHHGIATLPGTGTLHHHAWEVRGVGELVELADRLYERGRFLLWGPVRHGIGRNIAVYFLEPSGAVIEVYTDMDRIYDEARFTPGSWSTDDQRWYSFWAPMRPEGFRTHGLPPIARTSDVHGSSS